MSLPRWAVRYEQKAKRLIKRLHSLAKRKPEEYPIKYSYGRREFIRCDVGMKDPVSRGGYKIFSVQCITVCSCTAFEETARKRDLEMCAHDMARRISKESCKYCIDNVSVMTSPIGFDDRPYGFEGNVELSMAFRDLLMNEIKVFDENEARRKCYDDVMLRRCM